jgi:hypothetical protein
MVNTALRRLDSMFPGYFEGAKHNHYADFGYPERVTFDLAFAMYTRNGLARAGVDKTVAKTWQTNPWLLEKERDGSQGSMSDETPLERDIRKRFADLRMWQRLAEADRRSMVGRYCGVILRLADGKPFDQPVDRVGGGLMGLVEIIPAWEGQLTISQWDEDQASPTYGQPKVFGFNEAAVDESKAQARSFNVHPDRVLVWSKDGTVHSRSILEPGYNDLLTMEKISGAGGEGFWKNAKSAPVLHIDKDAKLENMARAMGVEVSEIADRMDEQVADFQRGFDKMLMLQGIKAETLGITLPSPEHFFAIALQSFAASIGIPLKILVGSQTGERASTEDAAEWSQTIMSRRTGQIIPTVMELVNRLERFGILPERDWHVDWDSLMDPSPNERLERIERMSSVNDKMRASGEIVFTADEMRAEAGKEPLTDEQRFRETPDEPDQRDALGEDPEPEETP